MLWPLILSLLAWLLGFLGAFVLGKVLFSAYKEELKKVTRHRVLTGSVLVLLSLGLCFISNSPLPAHFAMPPTMHSHAPGSLPASIPVLSAFEFLKSFNQFEQVDDIGADPNDVPAPIDRDEPAFVELEIVAKEVIG